VYGTHLAEATRMGANVIFVMTNDGWWDNTAGHKQHFSYSRLRAIELRRSVARSANTGISGFIDQRGQPLATTKWWESTALRHTINLNDELTFYARTGDVLYTMALFLSLGAIVVWLYYAIRGKTVSGNREI
ncbi:MAG: nitrilase-related carbon-nitrogen hydrolase, partial [Flavobacteriales bacterium]